LLVHSPHFGDGGASAVANEIDKAVPESPSVVAKPVSIPVAEGPRHGPRLARRFLDWLFMRQVLEQARRDEAQVAPERVAMIRLAEEYAAAADSLLDLSDDAPFAPVLSLYREALFLLLANNMTGKKALAMAFETAPNAVLEEAAQHDPSLARVRHLLAIHAAVSAGGPVTPDQREVAQMTRTTVRALLDRAASSRVLPLLRQRRSRVAFTVGLLAIGLAVLVSTIASIVTPIDLAAGKPWRTSSTLSAAYSAKILFHTNEEMNPWFEIDLGEIKPVRRLYIKNRADARWERAVPLLVELSNDRSNWQAVAKRESPFAIWEPSFAASKARYVRLRVPRVTYLHLEQVKVY